MTLVGLALYVVNYEKGEYRIENRIGDFIRFELTVYSIKEQVWFLMITE